MITPARRAPSRERLLAAALLAVAVMAAPAEAQKPGGPGGPPIVVTVSPSSIQFPAPGPGDFLAGWVDHPTISVTVDAPGPAVEWRLSFRAADSDLGGYGKPLQDMLWSPAAAGQWRTASTTDQIVTDGVGDATIPISLRMLLDWALDEPGSYGTGLVFVVEQRMPGPGGTTATAVVGLPENRR